MHLPTFPSIFSVMGSAVDRLVEAPGEAGRENVLITQNIASAVSHWITPSYEFPSDDQTKKVMETVLLCHPQTGVSKISMEQMNTASATFIAQAYEKINAVVKATTDLQIDVKEDQKIADIAETVDKEKISNLTENQIKPLLEKLAALVETDISGALLQVNGYLLNIFENIKVSPTLVYCTFTPGGRRLLVDSKKDLYSFVTAIVKTYMIAYCLKMSLWVARDVVKLKQDTRLLETEMTSLKPSSKLVREYRLNAGSPYVENAVKILVNETESLYNKFYEYVEICSKVSISDIADSYAFQPDDILKYFAGEVFTYAAQVDQSFSTMLKMTSWICPSTDDLEKDVVDFITNMLINHSVPSINLDSTNFERIYEQKRLQFSNMSTTNNAGPGRIISLGTRIRQVVICRTSGKLIFAGLQSHF